MFVAVALAPEQPQKSAIFSLSWFDAICPWTSHVLFDQKGTLDDSVQVPLRLIWTQDEDVIEDIIRATSKQTEIRADQFFALTEFGKQLEAYFQSMPEGMRLFYERRSRQYDRLAIEKTRVVAQTVL